MRNLETLQNSVTFELANHIIDKINDRVINNENKDDWHFYCFNEDYYIIGYYQASEWLKRHNIDAFEAICICQEYEKYVFGEMTKKYDNSEITVNMLAYVLGEELLYNFDVQTVEDLKDELNNLIK